MIIGQKGLRNSMPHNLSPQMFYDVMDALVKCFIKVRITCGMGKFKGASNNEV